MCIEILLKQLPNVLVYFPKKDPPIQECSWELGTLGTLTVTAILLVTSVLTVFISITLEGARDALATSAFHQALAVTS